MEFWTVVRFILYPLLLVFGVAWCLFFGQSYRRSRCAGDGWSFWLGAAVATTGACGFGALLVARTIGFSSVTSGLFTLGTLALTVVVVAGSTAIWLDAWRAGVDGRRRRCRLDD